MVDANKHSIQILGGTITHTHVYMVLLCSERERGTLGFPYPEQSLFSQWKFEVYNYHDWTNNHNASMALLISWDRVTSKKWFHSLRSFDRYRHINLSTDTVPISYRMAWFYIAPKLSSSQRFQLSRRRSIVRQRTRDATRGLRVTKSNSFLDCWVCLCYLEMQWKQRDNVQMLVAS